jgi:hypothetical protein
VEPKFTELRALLTQPTTQAFWEAVIPLLQQRKHIAPSLWEGTLRGLLQAALRRDCELYGTSAKGFDA